MPEPDAGFREFASTRVKQQGGTVWRVKARERFTLLPRRPRRRGPRGVGRTGAFVSKYFQKSSAVPGNSSMLSLAIAQSNRVRKGFY